MLRALGIGAGDEVITSPLSAAFTALAIMMAGATPVFADIDPDRLTIDPGAVEARHHAADARAPARAPLRPARGHGRRSRRSPRGTTWRSSKTAARRTSRRRPAARSARSASRGAFSFYPTKNLGALGDGGAIITNDAALADALKRLRNGGQSDRYHHPEFGRQFSRLDEMQAAILRARLPLLAGWTATRRALAARYRARSPTRRVVAAARMRSRPRLPPVRRSKRSRASALSEHLDATRHRHARALSGSDSAPGGAARPRAGRLSRSPTARATRSCSLPLHPALADVDLVAGRRPRPCGLSVERTETTCVR